jgi:very-short-patch-repair endonuclease
MTPRKPVYVADPASRPTMSAFADGMRLKPTRHEEMMWHALLDAFKPYRVSIRVQEPIGPYVADFYIAPCNVVIEVDGSSHFRPGERVRDQKRDNFMRQRNIRVMRFQNRQVDRSAKACATYILNKCLPLPKQERFIKVTICPPGSANQRQTQTSKRLFWRS